MGRPAHPGGKAAEACPSCTGSCRPQAGGCLTRRLRAPAAGLLPAPGRPPCRSAGNSIPGGDQRVPRSSGCSRSQGQPPTAGGLGVYPHRTRGGWGAHAPSEGAPWTAAWTTVGKNQQWIWGAGRRLLQTPKPESEGVGPSITVPGAITVNRRGLTAAPPTPPHTTVVHDCPHCREGGGVQAQGSPRPCPRPGTRAGTASRHQGHSPHTTFKRPGRLKKKPPEATQTPALLTATFTRLLPEARSPPRLLGGTCSRRVGAGQHCLLSLPFTPPRGHHTDFCCCHFRAKAGGVQEEFQCPKAEGIFRV